MHPGRHPASHPGTVLMLCDAGPRVGIGHVMRCLALGEEFQARGYGVTIAADLTDLPWVAGQVRSRAMAWSVPPTADDVDGTLSLLRRVGPAIVAVDSYVRPREVYDAIGAHTGLTIALVDGDPAGRSADIYVDQNIGAEGDRWALPPNSLRLAGLDYALMRSDVVGRRPEHPDRHVDAVPPAVLAFFGGTDPFGASPIAVELLAATGRPFDATVVAGDPERVASLQAVRLSPGQSVEVIPVTDRLVDLIRAADVVVSAAGTSTWELACLGTAAGLVCVADNQAEGYRRMVGGRAVAGVGRLEDLSLRDGPAWEAGTAVLSRMLSDPAHRSYLRSAAWRLVDGRGRERVVDAAVAARGGSRPKV